MSAGTCLSAVMATRMVLLAVSITLIKGECTFNASWTGRWFQSGVPNLLKINSTHIETKGECYEKQIDKYLVYDRSDNCYRCMAIHGKDASVIQYKETFCESKASMQEICNRMTGDAALYSMFRKYPEAKPISCPFKSAPFTFSYSRGSGECSNPPSRAESCTDDSRLVLKYQACPDVPSTESNVEELVCLATWKEGSTRYLVGKISQGNRRNLITDEDQYRCFIYQREKYNDKTIYSIAQSADATCSGIQNAFEGSKTMRFTTDNHHNRCKFPKWITDHHTWVSLDHLKRYRFTQKNATLNIMDEEKPKKKVHVNVAQPLVFQELGIESEDQRQQNSEKHMICHAILESQDQIKVQIVAHITSGCESGYVCMVFYKRDSNVIEIQQSENYVENPDEACANFNPTETSYITLITATLHSGKCPHLGRYTIPGVVATTERRKREQPVVVDSQPPPECLTHDYESLAVGCGGSHEMEFKSTCAQQSINAYSCHGSWKENDIHYVITSLVARKSTDPLRYCFIYTIGNQLQPIIEGVLEKPTQNPILRISSVSESCHRYVIPGVTGNWAYNFTSSGACTESADPNSTTILVPTLVIFMSTILALLVMR